MKYIIPTRYKANLLVRLWKHLSRRRHRQILLLMGLMLASALAEVVSLGAVLPFIGIITAPDRVFSHPIVTAVSRYLGIVSADQLVLPVTVAFVAAALIAGAIRILLLWTSTRVAFASGSDLSRELYRLTLFQPYQVHIARNSSEVISGVTYKVNDVAWGVLLQLLILISASLLLVFIMIALIAINPLMALAATIGFGASYGLIAGLTRRRLRINGQRIAHEQTQVIKTIQEGLGGIRDILLEGTQQVYCDVYRKADHLLRRAQGDNVFIGGSPRYAMEALAMVLIAAFAYGFNRRAGGVGTVLPMLGALAIGATRILPAMQQVYGALANITGNQASLSDVIKLLEQPMPVESLQPAAAPLPFRKSIRFDAVRFRYNSDGPWVLNDLTLKIVKGTRVGFIGSTGAGKSTTLDLLMGLLLPTEGMLLVDDQPVIGSHIRAWQRTIAQVPQMIYLSDTSLAENIAFGVPRDAIDMGRVRKAAHQAQIADFIESRPDGYNAYVGEDGIRLSGGQRQRIGIARALYKQASVLVFDEATSALDNATEKAVMSAIEGLNRDLTILLIAHRLTTVQHCDTIFMLEQGRVVAKGTYEQVLESCPSAPENLH